MVFLDMIMVFIMPIIIMHILKIYDVQILLSIQNGIINITLINISNNIFLVVLVIIQKTEQVFILGVVLATKGKQKIKIGLNQKILVLFSYRFYNINYVLDFLQIQVHASTRQTKHYMFRISDILNGLGVRNEDRIQVIKI